jgi:hypothetical protein
VDVPAMAGLVIELMRQRQLLLELFRRRAPAVFDRPGDAVII